MPTSSTNISLRINNTLNRTVDISLMGGLQDSTNQANAKTLYDYDLSTETFVGLTEGYIEARTTSNPTFVEYTFDTQITDIETLANILTGLGFGDFGVDGTTIFTISDDYVFGIIKIS